MADLLDIAPSTAVRLVPIADDQALEVRGLHGPEIAAIAARFPNLIAVLAGGLGDGSNVIALYGFAVGPIIAAACGHLGNEEAERKAGNLLIEDQIKLIKAIIGLSFPNGFGPVMEAINSLMAGAADENTKPVRVRLKTSPSPSPPLSGEDSRPNMQ